MYIQRTSNCLLKDLVESHTVQNMARHMSISQYHMRDEHHKQKIQHIRNPPVFNKTQNKATSG